MKHYKKISMVLLFLLVFSLNNILVYARAVKVPTTPTSLSYSGVTSSEATLKWQSVTAATGYKVYRATTNDSNYALIATITSNTYKNTGLSANTKYWYYVKAYNSAGTSAASSHISLTTAQATVSSTKKVLGYATYYYSGDSSSYNSMVTNSTTLDQIATHTYITDGSGVITGLIPSSQITYANSNNIQTLAMVSNNFDGAIAKTLLESSTNRQTLINNIVAQLKLYSYKGVNIDMEGVYYYDRTYLTTFMNELYTTLHAQGFYVTMAVPAKINENLTDGWSGAFDFPSLAKYADQIIIMTYDEHYPGGTPGPIASIGWVESVIKYTTTAIPKEKLLLGVPAYGYDWSTNGTKAYGITDAYNLAANNATIKWDSVSQSPYFTYSDSQSVSHTVWFENSQSLGYKLDLVNSYGLSGIAIWRLGFEDSSYWTMIKNKLSH